MCLWLISLGDVWTLCDFLAGAKLGVCRSCTNELAPKLGRGRYDITGVFLMYFEGFPVVHFLIIGDVRYTYIWPNFLAKVETLAGKYPSMQIGGPLVKLTAGWCHLHNPSLSTVLLRLQGSCTDFFGGCRGETEIAFQCKNG